MQQDLVQLGHLRDVQHNTFKLRAETQCRDLSGQPAAISGDNYLFFFPVKLTFVRTTGNSRQNNLYKFITILTLIREIKKRRNRS